MELNNKKVLALVVAAVMSMSAMTALAEEVVIEATNVPIEEPAPIFPFFGSYTGTVKEVTKRDNGDVFVVLESEEGGPSNFVITETTSLIGGLELKEGQTLTGFYENNRPMILIYPPQYNVSAVVEAQENLFVKADRFDKDLVSSDNMLKLNISEDTEIVWENGTQINWIKAPTSEELTDVLGDRKLIAFYDVSTKSIPAQTTPKKVVVLSGKEAEPVSDVSGFDIEVNAKVIAAPSAFQEEETVMVPLRAIAESLGLAVEWDSEKQSVTVGDNAVLVIGSKSYHAYETDIEMTAAPILRDGSTYVSMEFFKIITPANVYEGRIVFGN